jgi:uncharacterized linocin/CFP29 family protein
MDILKRNLAPITDGAWEEIEEAATQVLKANLSARRFVDVEGPRGWDYNALPLGRLNMIQDERHSGLGYGTRNIQPIVESRVTFDLDVWELDNEVRGAEDIDLEPLEEAARKIAIFEEQAIYQGLEPVYIKGLRESSSQDVQSFEGEPQNILKAISAGVTEFSRAGVEGPYQLICGPELWREMASHHHPMPLTRSVEKLLNTEIVLNPHLEQNLLISRRGGDMKLTLGVDFSIGYNSASAEKVKLFLTESFTFRVVDGAAIIPIEWRR